MATFICSDCGKRSTQGGDCSACGQGPLLDLADPSVVAAIREGDVQRQLKRERLLRVISLPIAAAPVLAVISVAPRLLLFIPLPIPFSEVIKVIVAITLVAFGVSGALIRIFRAKKLLPEGSDAETASTANVAAAMRSGGKRRLLVVAGILLGVGALIFAIVTFLRVSELQARARAAGALSDLQTCLVGDLEPGENLKERLRKLQLSTGAVEPSPDWPDRCARHGDALFAELETHGAAAHLRDLLATKASCQTGCTAEGLQASIADIVGAARSAQISVDGAVARGGPEIAGPPLAEMHLLTAKDFRPLAQKELVLIDSAVLGDGARIALLYRTPGARLHVCEVDLQKGETSCNPVPESVKVAVSAAKLARGEDEPIVYGITSARVTGGRDALGNERDPDKKGEPQKTEVERGAFNARTGERVPFYHGPLGEGLRSGVLLEGRGAESEVVVLKDGQESSRRTLGLSATAAGPWLAQGTIVYADSESGADRALYWRGAFDSSARKVGPLGTYGSEPPVVCASGETATLVFGNRGDTEVSFLGKSGLSAPVRAPAAVRVGPEPPPPPAPKPRPGPSATASAQTSTQPSPGASGSASSRFAITGPQDNPDPHIARQKALRDAAEFGMLGLLNSGAGGDPNAPTAPWGRDDSSGFLGSSRSSPRERREGPVPVKLAVIDNADVSCSGDTVARTWLTQGTSLSEVHQVRCTAAACAHEMTQIRGLAVKNLWLATTLEGKVLLVFRGALGDLRMRFAPLAELPAARDTVIMDSPEYGGPETGESHVFVGPKAVTILFRGEGLFGLRITSSGEVAVVRGS